jgi:hypothetical protein
MLVKDAIKQACELENAELAGEVVEHLRFRHRMTYDQCAEVFREHGGIDRDEFERLMWFADFTEEDK